MKILIACEYSGVVRDAFRAKGHDAWSADILPTEGNPEYNQYHYQGDVTEVLEQGWDMIIAHPPCTYLTNAGVRWLGSKIGRSDSLVSACEFFNLFKRKAPKVCIENPIPHKYAKEYVGDYTQLIQPWQFGEKKSKATCLWLEGLPKLIPTDVVGPPPKKGTVPAEEYRSWHEIHFASPGKERWKNRSKTF